MREEIRDIEISFEVMEEEIKRWESLHEQTDCKLDIETIKKMYNDYYEHYRIHILDAVRKLKPIKQQYKSQINSLISASELSQKNMFKLFLQCNYCAGMKNMLKLKSQDYPLKQTQIYRDATKSFNDLLKELKYIKENDIKFCYIL